MTNLRFRLCHNSGPDKYDRSYSSIRAAKAILTKQVRGRRVYNYHILDQETKKKYVYDEQVHRVVEKAETEKAES